MTAESSHAFKLQTKEILNGQARSSIQIICIKFGQNLTHDLLIHIVLLPKTYSILSAKVTVIFISYPKSQLTKLFQAAHWHSKEALRIEWVEWVSDGIVLSVYTECREFKVPAVSTINKTNRFRNVKTHDHVQISREQLVFKGTPIRIINPQSLIHDDGSPKSNVAPKVNVASHRQKWSSSRNLEPLLELLNL